MSFLQKLQSLPEPTKTKVLIGSTIVVMVIVLFLWLLYFNNIVSSPAQAIDQSVPEVQTSP